MSTSLSSYQAPATVREEDPEVLDLSVIIVNYNVREFLEQTLRSVQRASAGLSVEVFVVDNNSVDGSTNMVLSEFPGVHVIANERNVGFSRANNQAIRRARGRYLLILNPDTIVQEDTFSTLIQFMEAHPDAGAVGCKILNPDGTFAPESRRAFPTPSVAFYRMIGLSRLFPRSRTFGRYNMTYLPRDEVSEVDALSGSCMLVRHAALYYPHEEYRTLGDENGQPFPRPETPRGAGLLDEDFFMYGEDLDWCYRIQQSGWTIYYTPETQIIHYKGESTKKGELRYVRLFYGAMLRFTEKHFENRYSHLFAALLRAGILARAGLTVLGNATRRLAAPLLDFGVVFVVVALVGTLRSAQTGVPFPTLFYGVVAPAYGISTVAGIAALGGYRPGRLARLRYAWMGPGLALLLVSAASFFVKDIAFSRIVVGSSFVLSGVLLTAWRLVRRSRQSGRRRALLVGRAAEADRLHEMLRTHVHPPFELVGYVEPERDGTRGGEADVPRLGTLRHLRDLVRLRRINDVVFATDDVSNCTLFGLIQELRDLPVQFKMLAQEREHVIGKSSIEDLSVPALIEADGTLLRARTGWARRCFDVTASLAGLLFYPVARLLAHRQDPDAFWPACADRLKELPDVLAGRRTLVGYHPDDAFCPPEQWKLRPGLFAITDTLDTPDPTPDDAQRAYWFYVRHQSVRLDGRILLHALRKHRRTK